LKLFFGKDENKKKIGFDYGGVKETVTVPSSLFTKNVASPPPHFVTSKI